eukprot:7389330-Prymnesium_polylepis.1
MGLPRRREVRRKLLRVPVRSHLARRRMDLPKREAIGRILVIPIFANIVALIAQCETDSLRVVGCLYGPVKMSRYYTLKFAPQRLTRAAQ